MKKNENYREKKKLEKKFLGPPTPHQGKKLGKKLSEKKFGENFFLGPPPHRKWRRKWHQKKKILEKINVGTPPPPQADQWDIWWQNSELQVTPPCQISWSPGGKILNYRYPSIPPSRSVGHLVAKFWTTGTPPPVDRKKYWKHYLPSNFVCGR